MDNSHESVERNGIFRQLLVLAHPEAFEFELRLADRVVRTEIFGKLCSKQLIVRENWMVFTIQDHGLKPFYGKAPKIRKNIIDLMGIGSEHSRAIKKVQLALNEEAFELLRVRAVEGVGVAGLDCFRALICVDYLS